MTLNEHRWTPTNRVMVEALRIQYPEVVSGQAGLKAIAAAFPDLDEAVAAFGRVPDGIVVDAAERRINVFEVEVTHPIPRETMWRICELWNAADFYDITLDLYVVNRYGHVNCVDIAPWYLQLLTDRTS